MHAVRSWMGFWLGCLLPALCGNGAAVAASGFSIPAFEARYELRVDGVAVGTSMMRLVQDERGEFRLETTNRPTGFIRWFRRARMLETSHFAVDDDQIRPLLYELNEAGLRSERRARVLFDWERRRVRNSVAGSDWSMQVPPGTLDKLVVQLAMMKDLSADTDTLHYAVADGGLLKQFEYHRRGESQTDTPAGRFATVHMQRIRVGYSNHVELWCAPALHNLPVRLEYTGSDGETRYSSVLLEVSDNLRDEGDD